MRERIESWDFLKIATIMLVVWGHLIQYFLPTDQSENPLYCWIYTFHMPLFMVMSGFFAIDGFKRTNVLIYGRQKTKRLLVPALVWCALNYVLSLLTYEGTATWMSFFSMLVNGLWFLKSLFCCSILGFVAFRCYRQKWKGVVLTLLVSALFVKWSVNVMYPCFLFGILIKTHFEWIRRNMLKVFWISGAIFIPTSIMASLFSNIWKFRVEPFMSTPMDIHYTFVILGCRYLTMFIGLIGSVFFIAGFYELFAQMRECPIWMKKTSELGKYTLGIYAIQFCVIETFLSRFIQFPEMQNVMFWLMNFMVFPVFSIILTWIFAKTTAYICKNHPLTSAVLFGEKG